ncbi:hypothetical protein Q3G72_003893 [Acer saccharum]|nr:hypothetical protein Q3G72_003893 [Acer saccharum]
MTQMLTNSNSFHHRLQLSFIIRTRVKEFGKTKNEITCTVTKNATSTSGTQVPQTAPIQCRGWSDVFFNCITLAAVIYKKCHGFAAILDNRGDQAIEILQAACRRCAVDRVREPKCCRGFAAVLDNRGTLATAISVVRLPSSPTVAISDRGNPSAVF